MPSESSANLFAGEPDNVEAASRRLSLATYFTPLLPVEITEVNLPHWRQVGTTYFVTFRLADSLPAEKLAAWLAERETWLKSRSGVSPLDAKRQDAASTLSPEDRAEYHRRFTARIENWLDQGHGSLVLQLPECHRIVEAALRHFDGDRYRLGEFVVALNHVHILVTPENNQPLSAILHSWKSYTAKEIVKVEAASRRLAAFGAFRTRPRSIQRSSKSDLCSTRLPSHPVWQKESYDHIVRSPEALGKIVDYIRKHPAWEEKRWHPKT